MIKFCAMKGQTLDGGFRVDSESDAERQVLGIRTNYPSYTLLRSIVNESFARLTPVIHLPPHRI